MKKEIKACMRLSTAVLVLCGAGLGGVRADTIESGNSSTLEIIYSADTQKWTITPKTAVVSTNSNALVSGKNVYSYVNNLIATDASAFNINNKKLVTAKKVYEYVTGLTAGTVSSEGDNSGKLVTGAAVATAIDEAKSAVAADTAKLIKADGSAIVIGSDASSATSVSVGNRKITGVSVGEADTDAATVGQIAAKAQTIAATNAYVSDSTTKTQNVIYDNTGNALATFSLADANNLSATDTGFVSGGTLYSYVNSFTGGVIGNSNMENSDKLVTGKTVYDYLHQEEVAIGKNSKAIGLETIAVGKESKAEGTYAIAIGGNSEAVGYSIALGNGSNARGKYSISIGRESLAYGEGSMALGLGASTGTESTNDNELYATALGYSSEARALYSISIGDSVVSESAAQGIAIGRNAVVTAENGVAIGYEAVAVDNRTDAEKTGDAATRIQTVSFGHKATDKKEDGSTAFGTTVRSRLTNVADGDADTDAATVGQLKSTVLGAQYTIQSGNNKTLTVMKNDEAKIVTLTPVTGSVSSDNEGLVTGKTVYDVVYAESLNLGYGNEIDSDMYTVIGYQNTAHSNSLAVGSKNTAELFCVAVGLQNEVVSANSSAFGIKNVVWNNWSSAVGYHNTITDSNASAFGYGNIVTGPYASAFGCRSYAGEYGAVAIGYEAVATTTRAVSFGHKKGDFVGYYMDEEGNRSVSKKDGYEAETYTYEYFPRLINIEDGRDNHDAATVGQILKTATYTLDATDVNKAQVLKTNGDGNGPTIAISVGSIENENNGFVSGGAVYTAMETAKNTIIADTAKLIKVDSGAIVIGSDAAEATSVFVGNRKITGLENGTEDTDAATVGQLKSTVLGAQYTIQSGNNKTLTVMKNDEAKIVTLTPVTGSVSSDNEGLVTGKTVYDYVSAMGDGVTTEFADGKLKAKTAPISSDSNALVTGAQVSTYVNGLLGGEVATSGDNSEKLVTGAAVATAINEAKSAVAADTAKLIKAEGSAIVIGSDAESATEVSVGNRKIMGVSAGKDGTDAVNVSQMESAINAATRTLDTTIGEKLTENGNVITKDNSITGNLSALDTKIGKIPVKTEGSYKAIDAAKSISENLVAIDGALGGAGVDVSKLNTITRAESAEATGENSIALGTNAKAQAKNSIAFGTGSVVTGENSIAIGTGHRISGQNSGAFGDPMYIDADNSYGIGNNNKISGEKTFVLGNDVETSAKNAVVLGDGSTATEDNVVSVGSETNQRKIVNVAAGEADTDAANVGQLKNAMRENMGEVGRALGTLDSRVNDVAAGAAALAALHPTEYNPENKATFAVGYGHYRNANAGAFGAFFTPNEDVTVSLASTIGNGNPMVNAGVSFKIGKRGSGIYVKQDSRIIQNLMTENERQAKKIETLEADNAQMKADNEKMKAQIVEILKKLEMSETVKKTV